MCSWQSNTRCGSLETGASIDMSWSFFFTIFKFYSLFRRKNISQNFLFSVDNYDNSNRWTDWSGFGRKRNSSIHKLILYMHACETLCSAIYYTMCIGATLKGLLSACVCPDPLPRAGDKVHPMLWKAGVWFTRLILDMIVNVLLLSLSLSFSLSLRSLYLLSVMNYQRMHSSQQVQAAPLVPLHQTLQLPVCNALKMIQLLNFLPLSTREQQLPVLLTILFRSFK